MSKLEYGVDNSKVDQDAFDWNQSYAGDETDYGEPDLGILNVIDSLKPGRALDIGCGAGGLIVALSQRGWQVTGIDIAAKAIKAAEKIVTSRGLDAELLVADATQWQPAEHYDLVTNCFALPESRHGRASVYRMIKKALAPGGTVLLKDFDSTMNRISFFAGMDLVTVDEFTTAFAEFTINEAEVIETPVHEHSSGGRQRNIPWSAAFLYAQRP